MTAETLKADGETYDAPAKGTSNGPRCPACNGRPSTTLDSRPNAEGVRRRRRCAGCGYRFTTQERVDRGDAWVYVPDFVI